MDNHKTKYMYPLACKFRKKKFLEDRISVLWTVGRRPWTSIRTLYRLFLSNVHHGGYS